MRSIIEKNQMIERVHLLIKRRGTGTPEELASRLDVSRATVFRIIETMKQLGAPIDYDCTRKTFVYQSPVQFYFGFRSSKELSNVNEMEINAGFILSSRPYSLVSINEIIFCQL